MASENILAIFDFDGTLTVGHLWVGIYKHHRHFKVRRPSLYLYLFAHLPFWLAAKAKLYDDEKNRVKWGEDLPVLFKNFSREEMSQALNWIMDNYFMSLMRKDILAVLNEHKKQGDKIVLLSGMFTEFLEVAAIKLGIDYVVGTKLELKNNRFSGRIIKPLCFGENKAKFLKELIQKKHLEVNFNRSSAYADSIYDLPVFQMVGNPVATYPDKSLLALALKQEWRVIGDSLNTTDHL